jgi:DNA-binding NtrC family response regulator
LYIPPLSDRREDIDLLADHFLKELCATYNKTIKGFSPQAAAWLRDYRYEGNVRELRNIIERAVIVCEGKLILLPDLRGCLRSGASFPLSIPKNTLAADATALGDIEKKHIIRVLADTGRSMTKTAAALRISRTTLWRRIQDFGI